MSPAATENFPDFSGKLLDAGRIRLLEILGTGAYGKVYRALVTTSPVDKPAHVAVKCLRVPKAGSLEATLQAREFEHHQRVSEHPNIVSFHQLIHDPNDPEFLYVVLDLCEGGDLFDAIVNKNMFAQKTDLIRSSFLQLIDAISFCHQHSVYHRDIKPENVLCSKDGTQFYIADFGLSTKSPVSRDFRCGSLEYMSPDCIAKEFKFKNRSYSTRYNDIWALGVVLINLVTQRTPWNVARLTDPCFAAYLEDEDYFMRVLPISPGMNRILKKIFRIDPMQRLSLSDLRREILALDSFTPPSDEESGAISPVLEDSGSPRNSAALRRSYSSTASCDITALRIEDEPELVYEPQLPLSVPDTFLTVPAAARSFLSVASSLDSDGPITPETHAVDVDVEVPDLEEGQDMGVGRVEIAFVKQGKSVVAPIPTLPKKEFFRKFIDRLKASS